MEHIKRQLTAVYRKSGRSYIGWIEEIPGANTQAKNLKELKENLKEAAFLVIEANKMLTGRQFVGKFTRESIGVSF